MQEYVQVGVTAHVLNIKSADPAAGGLFLRREIEVMSPDFSPSLSLLDADTATALARFIGRRPLEAQFETQVTRMSALVAFGQPQIEAAFDDGSVIFVGQRVPLMEVELADDDTSDAAMIGNLAARSGGNIRSVTADGACDGVPDYQAIRAPRPA